MFRGLGSEWSAEEAQGDGLEVGTVQGPGSLRLRL